MSAPGGNRGFVLSDLQLIVYLPDDGLHVHVRYRDPGLEREVAFVLDDKALKALSDHSMSVMNEADAKAIARKKETRILVGIERWLEDHSGLPIPSLGPPRIKSEHLELSGYGKVTSG